MKIRKSVYTQHWVTLNKGGNQAFLAEILAVCNPLLG